MSSRRPPPSGLDDTLPTGVPTVRLPDGARRSRRQRAMDARGEDDTKPFGAPIASSRRRLRAQLRSADETPPLPHGASLNDETVPFPLNSDDPTLPVPLDGAGPPHPPIIRVTRKQFELLTTPDPTRAQAKEMACVRGRLGIALTVGSVVFSIDGAMISRAQLGASGEVTLTPPLKRPRRGHRPR